jgi:hypothetical protein
MDDGEPLPRRTPSLCQFTSLQVRETRGLKSTVRHWRNCECAAASRQPAASKSSPHWPAVALAA